MCSSSSILCQSSLTCLAEAAAEDDQLDVLVNCSGLGAGSLVSDPAMFPVSGHVLRVRCGHVGHVMADDRADTWAYVIPNMEAVVLGSVDTEDNWDTSPRPGDRDRERW